MYEAIVFQNKQTYNYTGSIQTYTVPEDGIYKLECWGAAGSYGYNNCRGGNGAYACGIIKLCKGETLYLYVGQWPNGSHYGGWNGGGNQNSNRPDNEAGGGGGASDIRILGTSLNNRILVAAGGAGGIGSNIGNQHGGAATSYGNYPAGQSYAGNGAGFGYGTNVYAYSSYPQGGGGGGGTTGNVAAYIGSSGGSSYALTNTSYIPPDYLVPRTYVLEDVKLIGNAEQMPTYSGGTEYGHYNHGNISISYKSTGSKVAYFAICKDGKYYIPTQNNYNFITDKFDEVTLDYLYDIHNLKYFIFGINDLFVDIITNKGSMKNIIRFFNNYKIVKFVTSLNYNEYNFLSPELIRNSTKENRIDINCKLKSDNLFDYSVEILEKFDSDNNLFHKLLSCNLSADIKVLIKYRGRYYGKDLKVIEDNHDLMIKAIDIKDISRYDINFDVFNIVIIFANKFGIAVLSKVKYINSVKEVLVKSRDIDVKYNNESIYVKSNLARDYMYLNITNGIIDRQISVLERF